MILLLAFWPFACVLVGLVVAFNAVFFLWHGWHYFRAMRRQLEAQRECSNCHAIITRPGARHCGHCGYKLLRAA